MQPHLQIITFLVALAATLSLMFVTSTEATEASGRTAPSKLHKRVYRISSFARRRGTTEPPNKRRKGNPPPSVPPPHASTAPAMDRRLPRRHAAMKALGVGVLPVRAVRAGATTTGAKVAIGGAVAVAGLGAAVMASNGDGRRRRAYIDDPRMHPGPDVGWMG